jgi:hypothetical protein
MLLARTDARLARRRGAILLIVLTLIALFSVVGLSFALYAEAEALAARTRREAKSTDDGPPPVDQLASAFLAKMLFPDESGPTYGTGNALLKTTRGHDDATMVFGDLPIPLGSNTVPYNGVGQFSDSLTLPTATGTVVIDRRDIINYSLQLPRDVNGNFVANTAHVVDPSHSGFRNNTQLVNSPGDTVTFPTKAYIARNAPYTYPDRLNVKVAMQDPTTGRILVPSYHRPSLFISGSTLTVDYSLDRSNPNWRDVATAVSANFNAAGRYKILRPRPYDHRLPGETEDQSQFPFPPTNPNGTITGDVQNIAQQDGRQQNDAVWVDMGLPMVNWRGRNLQPLVAATILPLDGRVNVNVAGNASGSSTNGFGPWEIGLGKITSDASAMVTTRTGGSTPNPRGTNVSTWALAQSITQSYTAVNWDGSTIATPMNYPAGNQSDPTYPAGFDSGTAANTEASSHPGLFLPYTWTAFTTPARLFPHTDLRRSAAKYAGKPYDYVAPYFGATAPGTLTATGPDTLGRAAALRRALLTTASSSLQRPQIMPNSFDQSNGSFNLMGTDINTGTPSGWGYALNFPFVGLGTSSDFGGQYNFRNVMASLGSVDLNRPLADYRAPSGGTGPLSPTNFTNFQNATNDRQTLARDIFIRLVVALGGKAIVNPIAGTIQLPQPGSALPNYDLLAPGDTTPTQYAALRYLAQLAANIVDTIDPDDVATTFVWNPYPPPPAVLMPPAAPRSFFGPDPGYTVMSTFFAAGGTTQMMRDQYTADSIVFGFEKPRAVINEVYGELVNDPADMLNGMGNATMDYHARFWIELLNPGNTQDSTSVLGDGTVRLRYDVPDGVTAAYNPYRLRVYRSMDAGTVITNLSALNNPSGDTAYPTATTPAIDRNFSETDGANATLRGISPNNGAPASSAINDGFAVFGPTVGAGELGNVFNPNTMTTTPPAVIPSMTNGHFTQTLTTEMGTNAVTGNMVVLQRLACPYLPPSVLNPYITVDYFQNATAHDVVRRANNSMADRTPTFGPSSGRREPFFGRSTLNNPQTSNVNGMKPGFAHSLFAHNDARNPNFSWLVHFDRPLVNPLELQMLPFPATHHVTQLFADATAAPQMHRMPFFQFGTQHFRALESLAVKPWGYGVPNEGRVPGKININMIWDAAVFEALVDQNASNTFTATEATNIYYNQTTPANSLIFGTGTHARTKDTATRRPGNTHDETGLDTDDRPFRSLGAPSAWASGGIIPGGIGFADTILRPSTTDLNSPAIFTGMPGDHPYRRSELLRKIANNFTTTTDTYLVVMTVGFFEVRNTTFPISTTNPLVLGREVFDQTAGDLRGKYVAIVDRSMMATDPTGQIVDGYYQTTLSETPYQPVAMGPYYVRFAAQGTNPINGNIRMAYEGRFVDIPVGGTLVVGTGANAEPYTVQALGGVNPDGTPAPAFNPATGLATVTLPNAFVPTRLHHAGDAVSNGVHQNPGPQPNFDVNNSRFKGLVPYFERIEFGK